MKNPELVKLLQEFQAAKKVATTARTAYRKAVRAAVVAEMAKLEKE